MRWCGGVPLLRVMGTGTPFLWHGFPFLDPASYTVVGVLRVGGTPRDFPFLCRVVNSRSCRGGDRSIPWWRCHSFPLKRKARRRRRVESSSHCPGLSVALSSFGRFGLISSKEFIK